MRKVCKSYTQTYRYNAHKKKVGIIQGLTEERSMLHQSVISISAAKQLNICSILYLKFRVVFFFIKMGSLTVQPKHFKSNISVEDIHIAEADCIISEIYRISDEIY